MIGNETAAHQTGTARGTEKAIVVPVSVFKRDELRASNTGDWFVAGKATFCEQLAETFCTIGLLVAAGETLSGEALGAVGAGEALSVPWLVLVRYAAASDNLKQLKSHLQNDQNS
mgnify:FL=1